MKKLLILLIFLSFNTVFAAPRLPGVTEFKDINSFMNQPQEEYSWSSSPRRKASEDKKPWIGKGNLWNLEQTPYPQEQLADYDHPAFPIWDWDFPDETDWGLAGDPWDGPQEAFFVCPMADCPSTINCGECWSWHVPTGDEVENVSANGYAVLSISETNNIITLCAKSDVDTNPVPNGSQIDLSFDLVRAGYAGLPAHCEKIIYTIGCELCKCIGYEPDIYASAETIDPGGTVDLWVDSDGNACPPYTWSLSSGSTGYVLSSYVTEDDLEITTLTSASGT